MQSDHSMREFKHNFSVALKRKALSVRINRKKWRGFNSPVQLYPRYEA
jgi:hypothetical protein